MAGDGAGVGRTDFLKEGICVPRQQDNLKSPSFNLINDLILLHLKFV